jgi:hypothetical protein
MAKNISASVGRNGVNRELDVFNIQLLLNDVPIPSGGPNPKLEYDGICGPKTIKAIQTFQIKHFGWSGADGRVDPNGRTHNLLNTFDKQGGVQPATPSPKPLPKSSRFLIRRMDFKTSFAGYPRELYFEITDMVSGLVGIYWIKTGSQGPTQQPPPTIDRSYRQFNTKRAYAIDDLNGLAEYHSSQDHGRRKSRMTLILSSGYVVIDNMPHHLIGLHGRQRPLPNASGITSLSGKFIFVRQG